MPAVGAAQKRLHTETTALRRAEAAVSRVPAEELGARDARRTLLKRGVLPRHVAICVKVIASAEFSHTTGSLVSVDAGALVLAGTLR